MQQPPLNLSLSLSLPTFIARSQAFLLYVAYSIDPLLFAAFSQPSKIERRIDRDRERELLLATTRQNLSFARSISLALSLLSTPINNANPPYKLNHNNDYHLDTSTARRKNRAVALKSRSVREYLLLLSKSFSLSFSPSLFRFHHQHSQTTRV